MDKDATLPSSCGQPLTPGSSFMGWVVEKKRNFFNAWIQPTIIHSPWGNVGRNTPSLNYPFEAATHSSSFDSDDGDAVGDAGIKLGENSLDMDMDVLDERITELESAVKKVLDEDTTPSNADQTVEVVSYENLGKLVIHPNFSAFQEKVPATIYSEIVAIYEDHLNETNKVPTYCEDANYAPQVDELKQSDTSKNKERNVRYEVLKWDKD